MRQQPSRVFTGHRIHCVSHCGFVPLVLEVASPFGHPSDMSLQSLDSTVLEAHGLEQGKRFPMNRGCAIHGLLF